MPNLLIDRLGWCLSNYHNAAKQGRGVNTDVQATAEQALKEWRTGQQQDAEDAHVVARRLAAEQAAHEAP